AGVTDTRHRRGHPPHIVPDILGALEIKAFEPQFLCEHDKDLPVGLRLSRGLRCLSYTVKAPLAARECPVLLCKAGSGKDDIRVIAGFCPEDILYDEEVQLVKRTHHVV